MRKILLGLIIVILSSCEDSNSSAKVKVENWYEGGTLHKSSMTEWKKATEKNKLATCGDYMATVDNTVSLNELKKRAKNLKNCIDEATRDLDEFDNESVSSIASLCLVTMGYQ